MLNKKKVTFLVSLYTLQIKNVFSQHPLIFQEGRIKTEIVTSVGGHGGGPRGGVTMLEHYQAVVSDGTWHHVQLYVVSRQAVQVLDNVTVSATLPSAIRTGLCFC